MMAITKQILLARGSVSLLVFSLSIACLFYILKKRPELRKNWHTHPIGFIFIFILPMTVTYVLNKFILGL